MRLPPVTPATNMASEAGPQRGVCVLGVSRSGTSAVAGMLVRAGCFAGAADDVYPADSSNPDGHYENLGTVLTNERLLWALGGTIFSPPELPIDEDARREAVATVGSELARVSAAAGEAPLVSDEGLAALFIEQLVPGGRRSPVAGRLRDAFRGELYGNRAGASEEEEHLNERQRQLWRFLSSLPAGLQRLSIPPELMTPSAAASETVCALGRRIIRHHELEVELTRRHDRNVELEAELARVRSRNVELEVELDKVRRRKLDVEAELDRVAGATSGSRRAVRPARNVHRTPSLDAEAGSGV